MATARVKTAALPKLVFEAVQHKETPGAFNMKEEAETRDVEVSGGIYIRKSALGKVNPARIRVTVEVLEAN